MATVKKRIRKVSQDADAPLILDNLNNSSTKSTMTVKAFNDKIKTVTVDTTTLKSKATSILTAKNSIRTYLSKLIDLTNTKFTSYPDKVTSVGNTIDSQANIMKDIITYLAVNTTTENGKEWTQSNITTSITANCICNICGKYLIGSNTGIYFSDDGKTWEKVYLYDMEIGSYTGIIYDIQLINTYVYFAGYDSTNSAYILSRAHYGQIKFHSKGKSIAADKIDLSDETSDTNIKCYKIITNNRSLSSPTIVVPSSKGIITLKGATLYGIANSAVSYICGTAGSGGTWVMGTTNPTSTVRCGLYYSINGTTWNQCDELGTVYIMDVLYTNKLFVAGTATAGIWYSTDGVMWTQSNITATNKAIGKLKYLNGYWIASSDTIIYYSTDGKTWSSLTKAVNNISLGNGLFLSASTSGISYGTTPSTISTIATNTRGKTFNNVFYSNGVYIATGAKGIYYSIAWEL